MIAPDSPQYHDDDITFESTIPWSLSVTVQSNELGEATATVPLEVAEQRIIPAIEGVFVLLVIIVILVEGFAYVWYGARRQRRGASK